MPPAVDGPASLGPYIIDAPAGQGSMGTVYRAHHRLTGQPVALKAVHTVRPDLAVYMDREIAGLGRIAHPQIVSIVDHGLDEAGRPWLAMRWLSGVDLAEHLPAPLSDGEPVPDERIDRALEIGAQLCVPLGWLHGEGLVHGDVKPTNIRVVDGLPVLLDLGLSQAMRDVEGRESADLAGLRAGSRGYMPPEQRHGDLLDGRADLWSLGAVIVAMLTGRPPRWRDLRFDLERHPGLSPGLIDLLEELLRPDPRDRPAYAADVAERLRTLGAPAVRVAARPALHRPRCQGRAELVERLVHAARQGGSHAVVGTSGRGKTRVLLEVGQALTRTRRPLVRATAERDDPRPHALLVPLLRTVARRAQREGAAAARSALGEAVPVLRAVVDVFDKVPGLDDLEPAPHLAPDEARTRLARAVWEACGWVAEVVVLDDLHWADPRSLELLPALVAERPPGACLLLAWRDDEAPDVLRELDVPRHRLGRLSQKDVNALLTDMLASADAVPETLEEVTSRAEGNPWFAAESLRAAVEVGALTRRGGRWRRTGPLPEASTVQRLVEARWTALGDASHAALEVAAVLGRVWESGVVEDVLGAPPPVGELLRRGWIERAPEGRWTFSHAALWDGVRERLDDRTRRDLHGRVADVLIARRGDAAGLDIGRHLAAAGRIDEAVQAWASLCATQVYRDPELVVAAARATLAQEGVPRPDQVRAWLWISSQSFHMNRVDEARAAREGLWENYLDVEGVERLVLCLRAEDQRLTAPAEDVIAAYRRALALPRFEGRTRDGYVLSQIGNLLMDVGRLHEALEALQAARSRAIEEASEEGFFAVASLVYIGKCHGLLHDWDAQEACLAAAESSGVLHRFPDLPATISWCRGKHQQAIGHVDAAEALFLESRQRFEDLRGARAVLWLDVALAELDAARGRVEAAWERLTEALEEHAETHAPCQWAARVLRARLARLRGQPVPEEELTDLEARVRQARYLPLLLRTRWEQTWGRPLRASERDEIASLTEACGELLQPGASLTQHGAAWQAARPTP